MSKIVNMLFSSSPSLSNVPILSFPRPENLFVSYFIFSLPAGEISDMSQLDEPFILSMHEMHNEIIHDSG